MKHLDKSTFMYRQELLQKYGEVDEEKVRRHALARHKYLKGSSTKFNVFTEDPNCKSCGKNK